MRLPQSLPAVPINEIADILHRQAPIYAGSYIRNNAYNQCKVNTNILQKRMYMQNAYYRMIKAIRVTNELSFSIILRRTRGT